MYARVLWCKLIFWTGDDRQRHSSTDQRYDNRSRVQHMESSSSATPEKHLQRPSDRPKSQAMDVSNSSSTPGPSMQRGGPVQRNNSTHTETSHSQNHAGHMAHPDLKRNSVYPYGSSSGAGEPARKRTRHESDNNRPLGPPSHRGEGEYFWLSRLCFGMHARFLCFCLFHFLMYWFKRKSLKSVRAKSLEDFFCF